MLTTSLIETDSFPFEFLSQLGEHESWRKEVHRPIYHVHKWWANRLGSVFRGILLGCSLPKEGDLVSAFYGTHSFANVTVFDPFMGSGTTVGEAHKLGFTALGRDINPVAVEAVRVALGAMDRERIEQAFRELSEGVGRKIRSLYHSKDSRGRLCDALYYFWVMQVNCPSCSRYVDLFPSWVIARNAYPDRKPVIQVLCPRCGNLFRSLNGQKTAICPSCAKSFDPENGPARGTKATCQNCSQIFTIIDAVGKKRPDFRLYGKLVLTEDDEKEYIAATAEDKRAYEECSRRLKEEEKSGRVALPTLALEDGVNTRQAMGYGFLAWRDFFNDRQLLALSSLQEAIAKIPDEPTRGGLLTLFSGILEFNNLFASYKGEGTGAVRHMFSHHILKPERAPIEANVWGTAKSSGSFSGLFRSRLLRAIDYRQAPTEVNGEAGKKGSVCSPPFTGEVRLWPGGGDRSPRAIYLSCGDSSETGLPEQSVDFVVTDPPFFDNVHYSELADFFYAWQQLVQKENATTTRSDREVQDADAERFAKKLQVVFRECHRVLKDNGLLVFTYHHSREEGWKAVVDAVFGGGFVVVNSHPVKSEMSVGTPKSQAKEPIQFDMILVCRKASNVKKHVITIRKVLEAAREKTWRLERAGFNLSRNDRRIILFGHLLTTVSSPTDSEEIARRVEGELQSLEAEDSPLFRWRDLDMQGLLRDL